MLGWWRNRKRQKLLSTPRAPLWDEVLATLPFAGGLTDGERSHLIDLGRVIAEEKRWEACGGLELTEEMPITIALQASLLILSIDHEYFRTVESVFIYPSTYMRPGHMRPPEDQLQAILGEAWLGGPTVLAWDAVRSGAYHPHDGRNLVLHEFAHKLDMLDGLLDGTPPLDHREDYARWRTVLTREFAALEVAVGRGRKTVIDRYGATNPAEFFAVATETFFEQSQKLKRDHPELYETLAGYYRQDPEARPRMKSHFG